MTQRGSRVSSDKHASFVFGHVVFWRTTQLPHELHLDTPPLLDRCNTTIIKNASRNSDGWCCECCGWKWGATCSDSIHVNGADPNFSPNTNSHCPTRYFPKIDITNNIKSISKVCVSSSDMELIIKLVYCSLDTLFPNVFVWNFGFWKILHFSQE